MVEWFVMPAWL